MRKCLLLLALVALLGACSKDDDEMYPSVITDMADLYTDASGAFSQIVLDNGTIYAITNPQTGYHASAIYRVLVGYVPTDTTSTPRKARLYSSTGVNVLRDSTARAKTDPTKVLSLWRTARYINLHLAPLTYGGKQYWGFITDSITTCTDGTKHAYVTLHHNQNSDPTSYTTDVYASLPLDSIKYKSDSGQMVGIPRSTPVTVRICTFNGVSTWDK